MLKQYSITLTAPSIRIAPTFSEKSEDLMEVLHTTIFQKKNEVTKIKRNQNSREAKKDKRPP